MWWHFAYVNEARVRGRTWTGPGVEQRIEAIGVLCAIVTTCTSTPAFPFAVPYRAVECVLEPRSGRSTLAPRM